MFSWLFGKKSLAPLSPEQDAFLGAAVREYNVMIDRLKKDWGFDRGGEWGFSQESGKFFLRLQDGSRVEADGQALGSFAKAEMTWEWAWNNPNVEEGVKRDAHRVREYGASLKIEYLTRGFVDLPEPVYATYLSALAVKATKSDGVFAGEAGPVLVYLGLKNLKKVKA